MFPVLSANSPSGSYVIPKSLRFRSSASAYLSRTPASAGNRTTWTYSVWHKRGQLGTSYAWLMNAYSATQDALDFSADRLDFWLADAVSIRLTSTAVYRDPSAWYHIVLAFDSTQATASNRIKMYVNGVQLTSFSTANYPSQNYQCPNINNTVQNEIGYVSGSTDGYMAEINFIDGQALTPSSFGAFDAKTGVWMPAKYSGSYGTNGFYLKFTDTTGTTTLGYDSSGNSNNWTPNNISLTAGSTYDSMLDSPTNYDNGGNGVGNYAVANPLSVVGSTLTDGNLSVSVAGGTNTAVGSIAISSGKWYWENTVVSATTNDVMIGLVNAANAASARTYSSSGTWYYYGANGNKYVNGSPSSYGSSYTAGDVVGIAFDSDNGTLTFYKNGVSQGVAASSGLTGISIFPVWGNGTSGGAQVYAPNFGQRPFAFTPPTGYKALNTQNLSAPSIVNGAGYMAASLYTGNSGTQSIVNAVNGVSFAPDFVWLKIRSTTGQHVLSDTIRGPSVQLFSSLTNAETSEPGKGITAFNSNGFTLGNELAVTGSSNLSGATYVGWQWKAGGTAVTNTAGSITSSVSANTTAGFSVVTWTGTAASAATVGHGLGVAPSLVIIKQRNGSTYGWMVYHSAVGAGSYLVLNQTYAATADSAMFNNTAPTSSVFTLSSGGDIVITNPSAGTMVAYCFAAIAGYSAFGSYTGNGSADGPFVFTGMRPRWILIKSSSNATDWVVFDTSRDSYNMEINYLVPNTSGAETSGASVQLDGLSNGFKVRGTWSGMNASGGTYVYAAFAENPFQISRAR